MFMNDNGQHIASYTIAGSIFCENGIYYVADRKHPYSTREHPTVLDATNDCFLRYGGNVKFVEAHSDEVLVIQEKPAFWNANKKG